MHQKLHAEPEFQYNLSQCSNLNDVRKLIAENEEKNAELVKQSCANMISLMSSIFECLSLKGNKIEVSQSIIDDEVEAFFQANDRLDKELTGNQRSEDFDKRLKLKELFGPIHQAAQLLLFN